MHAAELLHVLSDEASRRCTLQAFIEPQAYSPAALLRQPERSSVTPSGGVLKTLSSQIKCNAFWDELHMLQPWQLSYGIL